jgi:subtilisin-like proprotein convertase family protein
VEFILHVESDHIRVEHVLLTTSIKHSKRGQLEITLISPDGTQSRMATLRKKDRGTHYEWTFESVRHWGEMAKGDWKVRIADRVKGKAGVISSLKLTLWGSAPSGALVKDGMNPEPWIAVGETKQYNLIIRNRGSAALTNVVATLAPNASVTGTVTSGSFASISPGEYVIVKATLTGTGTLGTDARLALNISANDYNDVVRIPLLIGNLRMTIRAGGAIALPSFSRFIGSGPAGPYPATVNLFDVPPGSVVTDVSLRLYHVDHERSQDLDMLLVSPDGKRVLVMSDVGGYDVRDENIELTDAADNPLPDTAPLFGGTFRPANYGAMIDKFPAPAPPKPYQSSFSAFRGSPASGEWKLFIYDDGTRRYGSIGSWSLEVEYAAP